MVVTAQSVVILESSSGRTLGGSDFYDPTK
jgi:hypothetical protein